MLFLAVMVPGGLTGGLLAYPLAPIVTYYLFSDWRFWRYVHMLPALSKGFYGILYRNLTDPQYRALYSIPLGAPPRSGPDLGEVRLTATWTAGAQDCADCQACCTQIQCPLLDTKTGLCRSYDSFFWRYFNCGRFPLTQEYIQYYSCPKWEMIPLDDEMA